MKLQFAVWIAIIALSHKSTCISSDINQVASERRDIEFASPSDYNDEENEEKIIENDLLLGTSLHDFSGSNTTLNSSSTSDVPKITWSLVSSSQNSASQDDTSTVPQSKTKASSLSIEATTSMPLHQNSSAFPNLTSSFSHALDSGDNELDSDISDIATESVPSGDLVSNKDHEISFNDTTTSHPTTEFLKLWSENEKVNFSYDITTNFVNESPDDTTTNQNPFDDVHYTVSDIDDVSNSSDYLNFTSVDDFPNNANTSDEDDYVTFIPDITTNDFPLSDTDIDVPEIDEDTAIASSTVKHLNSPTTSELTSPVPSFETATSPSSIPDDLITHAFGTESRETVQDNKHQMIGADSEPITLPFDPTETPFPTESGLDSIDNSTAWIDFDDKFPTFDNESTENTLDSDNNLVPLDARTEMELTTPESFTVPPSANDDEYLLTTGTVTKSTIPTEFIPVHPLFTDSSTETVTNDPQHAQNTLSSSTAPSSRPAHTDIPENELEKSVTLPSDNITNSPRHEIPDDVSNIDTIHLDDDVFKLETSTPDTTTISEMSTNDDAISNATLNELSTRDHQTIVDIIRHATPIPSTTLNEIESSLKHQDGSVIDDDGIDNELFHSSNEHPSTTERKYFFQSTTLPYNTDDSVTMPSSISTEINKFSPSEYDLNDKEFDVEGRRTVSNEISESSTDANSKSTTITALKGDSNEFEFGNNKSSSQEETETNREGKHIPFSTRNAYERRPSKPTVPSSISPNLHTSNNEVGTLYNQIKQEDLTTDKKRDVITAILQIHPLHYEREELNEKIIIAHLWLLHAIVGNHINNSLNLTADVKRGSSIVAFEKLPKISYVLPTPEINVPNITLSFIVQLIGQNDTLSGEYLVDILNMHKEDLKILANVKSVKFFHGLPVKKFDFLTAIMERYGIIVFLTCVATVGMIILLICVVVYYRRKARHSAHSLTNIKLHRNMQEAMGIDLNPAVIILQDEIREKTVLNGSKICSIDDDEGWLAPIDDVPIPEDSNGPCIQDTKL